MTRRTCPACARRYGGLVDDTCPVCHGIGVLPLGAAALAQHDAPAVARSVELYLEQRAQAGTSLPLARRGEALEAAVLELRSAGILAHSLETARTSRPPTDRPTSELDAHRLTRQLTGRTLPTPVLAALAAPPMPLEDARPDRVTALASSNGHRSHTARAADPLSLDLTPAQHDSRQRTRDHQARVLAGATDRLTRKARTA